MALSDIISKILSEAAEKIKRMEHDTKLQAKTFEKEFDKKLEQEKLNMKEKVAKHKKMIESRMETHAKMEERNIILKTKRETINKVFEEAIIALSSLPEEKIKEILEKILKTIPKEQLKDKEYILHPAKSQTNLLKHAVSKSKIEAKIGAEKNIQGGFILDTPTVSINYSFENIIKNTLMETLEEKVANILFGNIKQVK